MLRHLSLTRRLTLFFTVLVVSVILGLGGLFMTATNRHFMDMDRSSMQDKQHLITDILSNANSIADMRWRLSEALNHHHGLFVRVTADGEGVLFQTDGFPASNHLLFPEQETRLPMLTWWQHGKALFRAQKFQIDAQYASRAALDITLAMDTRHHRYFLAALLQTLTRYALAAIIISIMLSWLVVYYGLAPLRAIKAHAQEVTAQRLQACMPVESVPVEMADLARTLNQMLERLQDDFRRLSEFSSDLAHELRTPLSNLLTQTQVTLSAKRENETYREILVSNTEELQRLARMVSDMLFLAKTEHGVDLPSKEYFSVTQEVQALLEFYEAVFDEKKVSLSLRGNGNIHGDRLMFRRALSNLLSNALNHTPLGGAVQVVVRESAQATEVSVENTGEGIDPKVLPRLFERFYRAAPARARLESHGAGLGLPITKAIVEAHHGTIDVESVLGKTQFRMVFPHHPTA